MHYTQTKILTGWIVQGFALAIASAIALSAQAAVPGITGPTFNLQASPGVISQPDGTSVYTWGYGCNGAPAGSKPDAVTGSCGAMQLPGPTLIVTEGQTVTVTLTNNLPKAAGNTSILFPGFDVTATDGTPGVLTSEATAGSSITYSFVANKAGTHAYYSGTQGDLQVEMGLYGALIVLPDLGSSGLPNGYSTPSGMPATCRALGPKTIFAGSETDFRLAPAAYNHPSACYDREYLFQLSAMDLKLHYQVQQQVAADNQACTRPTGCLTVSTEPYVPSYFMVNGRSFPDVADPHFAVQYPNQPYNGNPHAHPGELVLLRVIGTGRWQHPLHEHGNHIRILARDGNMLLSPGGKAAGPLVFTTTSTPGQAIDGIYQWTSKGLNWDIYGHGPAGAGTTADSITGTECHPDANGYYTTGSTPPAALTAINYYEWCGDHGKALESAPFGQVGGGGVVTLPDPNLFAMGAYYGGSPYFGAEATGRGTGTTTPVPPSGTVGNTSGSYAFMWHSHNEREITTNNAFPGGMMMMLLVDPWEIVINEAN